MKLKDNFLKDLDKTFPYVKSLLQDKTLTEDNFIALYLDYIKNNFIKIILSLSPKEVLLFFSAYKTEGISLSSIIGSNKDLYSKELDHLYMKGLLSYRASIAQVQLSHKLFLFEEVREIIKEKDLFRTQKKLAEKIMDLRDSSLSYKAKEVPHDIFQYFYSYGFFVVKEFIVQQFGESAIQYLLDSGYIVSRLYVKEEIDHDSKEIQITFCHCYEFITTYDKKNQSSIKSSINYHTTIFNNFIKICYMINRDGIGFTKKNEVNRKNLERFTKEVEIEQILMFFINFLKTKNYLEKINEQDEIYKLNEKQVFNLFKNDIALTYKNILNSDPFIKYIIEILLSMSFKEFSVADVVLAYLKVNIKMINHNIFMRNIRRQIIGALEMLHYIGFTIKHYNDEGTVLYTLSEFATSFDSQVAVSKINNEKNIRISSSLEVFVNLSELDFQSSYIINIFMDLVSFSTVISYQLSRISCARALYFGFTMQDLMDVLEHQTENLSDSIKKSIFGLEGSYKEGFLEQCIVLEASDVILDQLMLQPEYQNYIVKRISPGYAIVTSELKIKRILEEDYIFLKTK